MQIIENDIVKPQKAMEYKGIIENIGKVCAASGGYDNSEGYEGS